MGDELDNLIHELEMEAKRERPLSADDAFGAPSVKRYKREVARRAWKFLNDFDRSQPLPDWVADYLQTAARRIQENLGPQKSLSRESADFAIGIDGKAWPEHPPESVYLRIKEWRDKGEVSGPEEGATRYVQEVMKDETVTNSRVIGWYKEGKRSVEKQCAEIDAWAHPEEEIILDRTVANHPPFIVKGSRRRRSDRSN